MKKKYLVGLIATAAIITAAGNSTTVLATTGEQELISQPEESTPAIPGQPGFPVEVPERPTPIDPDFAVLN